MTGVVRLDEHGGPEVLRYGSETVGEPAAGQVRLRQEAIGVNFVDTYFRTGAFPVGALPAVIGGEGAGVVDAVGPGVDVVSVGDRVGYYFSPGAYAEVRLIAADELIPLPDDVPAVEAAALLAKGLTAWGRLRRVHAVRAGEIVLVTGATGGVGSLLAPWGQHLGATVVALVAGPERVVAARALGLEHVVVAGELGAAVTALGPGVDVLYDTVGRATFAEAAAVLRDGATVDLLGAASGDPEIDAADLDRRHITVTRSAAGQHLPDRATLLEASTELFAAWRSGVFGKRQVRRYPLADAAQAHRDLESRIDGAALVLLPAGN